jgi:hypothetical protein
MAGEQIQELYEMIDEINKKIATLKGEKGDRGPRGPAGDHEAASANALSAAASVVDSKLSDLVKRIDDSCQRTQKENSDSIALVRKELSDFRGEIHEMLGVEGTKRRIENVVVDLLVEYWLLDSNMNVLDKNQKPIQQEIPVVDCGKF